MKESSSKHERNILHHCIEETCCLPKRTYTHPYTPPTEHKTTPRTKPPPTTNPKNLRNPHPYTWSKNPYKLKLFGRKKKCAVVKWNLLQPIRHYIVTLSGNFPEDPISRSTQWHIDWTTHDNHRLDSRWAIQWPSRKWAYPTLGKGKSSLPS